MEDLFNAKASIYTLDNDTKKWNQICEGGFIRLYANNRMLQWTKSHFSSPSFSWFLIDSKIKPRGDKTWVTKVKSCENNINEIIAIKFSNTNDAIHFSKTYQKLTKNIQPQKLNKWICNVCTFTNNIANANCVVCNASQSSEQLQEIQALVTNWTCKMCNYHLNNNSSPCCRMCGLENHGLSTQQNECVSTWICAVCTYTNDTDATTCTMCGLATKSEQTNAINPFPVNNPNATNDPKKWICTVCTLTNDPVVLRCDACNTPQHLKENGIILPPLPIIDSPVISHPLIALNNNILTTYNEFKRVICHIAVYCNDPYSLFSTIISVINKLATKDDVRYQTLDTTNPKVQERLIGFEGVTDLLILLGFQTDEMGIKLHCAKKPSLPILRNAMKALIEYQLRFDVGKLGSVVVENGPKRFVKFNEKLFQIDEVVVFGYVRAYGPLDKDIPPDLIKICTAFYFDKLRTISRTNQTELDYDDVSFEQIIYWATNSNDSSNKMEMILMTYTCFIDSISMLKILRKIFYGSTLEHTTDDIRLNILNWLQHWIKLYWKQDFIENNELKKELSLWFDEELLNDKFRKEQNISNHILLNLITSISNQYNFMKLFPNISKRRCELILLPDDKIWEMNELLVCGYIRKQYSIPNALMGIFLRFYHENIVIHAKAYKCGLRNYTAEDLAKQITLMDQYIFNKIKCRELVNQNWKKQNASELSPNVMMLIEFFNRLSVFIQIEILKQRSVRERGKIIGRMIKLCAKLFELRNYNSLCAVYSALNSAPIRRLRDAWEKVSEKYTSKFEEIALIFNGSYGHRNLRQILRSAKCPCIPHIGIMLIDLVFIDEGNQLRNNCFRRYDRVNINKIIRMTETIHRIKTYQSSSDKTNSYYNIIKENLQLQKVLLSELEKLKDITEDQIWDMSSEIKKIDAPQSPNFP
eukprot:547956_1